jgi:Cft2 family RNA processing exonuclease
MTSTPGQLLVAIVADTAELVLARPAYRDVAVDRARFATQNRAKLLAAIARQKDLRAHLAELHADELGAAHPLIVDLLGTDAARSAAAATQLGTDPAALTPPAVEPPTPPTTAAQVRPEHVAAPASADAVDTRRAHRLQRDLGKARQSRDQARGRLEYAQREITTTRQERDAALNDRDEALTVIESLRAALAGAQARAEQLAGDVTHAAAVLASALRPSAAPAEVDVRELDRRDPAQDGVATGEALATEAPELNESDARVTTALGVADLDAQAFLAVLDAITTPPAPVYEPVAYTRTREIVVTPLGGGTDIGGSCILIEAGDARILIDAGTRPKQPLSKLGPPDIDVALAGHIDAVVITHAHNDHAGYVPVLTSHYPWMDVFCTVDTAALLPTMWNDSVKVFERTRHEHVAYGAPADEPPYRQPQVAATQDRLQPLAFGREVEVADGVTIELFPAGHILGAAGVVISAGSSRVTVTGDVSNLAHASVPGLVVPESARHSELIVIESTYCRAGGESRPAAVERFVTTVAETVSSGGRVLVPAFALGRAQEVVLTLRNRLPDVPVLVDGLAKTISRIYEQQTADTDNPLSIYGEQVREVLPGTRREQYTAMRRGVIVTTSGMLTGGPAVTWARWILPDPNAALLVSGYQDEESAGAELLALVREQSRTFLLEGEEIEVNANVKQFGLSAHADRAGLTSIIGDVEPDQVMLVHGLASAQRDFSRYLGSRGYSVARTDRWQNRV